MTIKTKAHDSKTGKDLFINPDLSWLAFNERVFACAMREDVPLLERLRFLAIAANNLDEFFMVQMSEIENDIAVHPHSNSIDGLPPEAQFREILTRAVKQMNEHVRYWRHLRKELRANHIDVTSPRDLDQETLKWLENYFIHNIFPVLTPMAIDEAHPVPLIPTRGIAIIVQLLPKNGNIPVHAIIPLPSQLSRFVEIPVNKGNKYILLEHVIALFIEHLFSNYAVLAQGMFRIIRNSDMALDAHVIDLRHDYEEALARRLHGEVIQLSVNARMSEHLRLYVAEQFNFEENEIVVIDGTLGLNELSKLISHDYEHLLYPSYVQRTPQRIHNNNYDMFEAISIKDILVHHPYETFETVLMFLRQAAKDKKVLAIKQTLYRTGDDSPIIEALIEAAKSGKSVTVLIEIKARFDEETNIRWTKDLENAGVHVIYGIVGLKTHGKLTIIMRQEHNGLKSYAHFGTGNYNSKTAKIYTDLSLFTADPILTHDASCIFNYITGYTRVDNMKKIAIAPFNLRQTFDELIDNEITNAKKGLPAAIWAKLNSLTDKRIITKLYEASNHGVQIDLIVRGKNCLRAGIPGLSENIRLKSIIGRFLEHSRIYCFANGQNMAADSAKVYISSADWMPRNLNWRLELLVPVENITVKQQIIEQVMYANLKDTENSWLLQADGTYHSIAGAVDPFDAFSFFIRNPSLSGNGHGPYPMMSKVVSINDD